jgi:hypothetical protein
MANEKPTPPLPGGAAAPTAKSDKDRMRPSDERFLAFAAAMQKDSATIVESVKENAAAMQARATPELLVVAQALDPMLAARLRAKAAKAASDAATIDDSMASLLENLKRATAQRLKRNKSRR